MRPILPSGTGPSAGRRLSTALLAALALVALALVAAGPPASAQTTPRPALPWWDASFEANERACTAANRPAWCVQWVEALDTGLRPFGDRTVPEWRAIPYERNREICSTLLPPTWCAEWRAFLRTLPETDAYKAVAERHEATTKAENEVAARARAEREAYEGPLMAVLTKVTAGLTPTRAEVELLETRATVDGSVPAAETLAWLYAQGKGVGRDYGRAYELYGDLVLKGREDLRKNLDALWPQLTGMQKQAMQQKFGPPANP